MSMRAVVVGAGVGGLAGAIGLRRAGWSVEVVERWPGVIGVGAGIGLWPDAQRVLDSLGVGEQIRAAAVTLGTNALYRDHGRRLAIVPERRMTGASTPVRILPRPDLIRILAGALGPEPVRCGVAVEGRPGSGVLELDGRPVEADLIVGADGLGSTVRRAALGSTYRPRPTGLIGWRGAVPLSTLRPGRDDTSTDDKDPIGYGETWGDGSLFGVTRLPGGRVNWFAALPGSGEHASGDREHAWQELRAHFAGWRDPVPAVLAAADPQTVLRHPLQDLWPPLPTFTRDRIALIGDAAHAMTPNLGRGACETLLDVATLLDCLDGVTPHAVPDALTRYDAVRRRPAQRTAARSHRMMGIATATGVRAGVRDAAIRVAAPLLAG